MITFTGLMKITGDAYGVIKYFKGSILQSILFTYWGIKVCILKVVIHLCTKLV